MAFARLGEISLLTNDVPRLADFYKKLLGVDNHSGDPVHQFLLEDGVALTVYNDGSVKNNHNENMSIAFTVEDIHAAHERVRGLGAQVLQPPTAQPWGAVNMRFLDPDGNTVYLRQLPEK